MTDSLASANLKTLSQMVSLLSNTCFIEMLLKCFLSSLFSYGLNGLCLLSSVSVHTSRRVSDVCQTNPCQNRGVCIQVPHSSSTQCSCPQSFTGSLCQHSGCSHSSFHLTTWCPDIKSARLLFFAVSQFGLTSVNKSASYFNSSKSHSSGRCFSIVISMKSCWVSLCSLYS